tara:strand:+ start:2909 stop:3322 length:414 start_codon:yes stop_codon:yes gene_type:complete
LPIYFHKEQIDLKINEESISSWIDISIKKLKFEAGDISVIFCSDDYLKQININYLNHDYYTDIITFDYSDKNIISGDLFISIDRVRENADINNENFNREICRVIIHGILHLCGYNDKTSKEKEKMRKLEDVFLSTMP